MTGSVREQKGEQMAKIDPIDRQEAIDAFSCDGSFFVYGADVCKAIVSRLKQLPSAQPKRKTGKWIKTYRNGFGNLIGHCNKCGRRASVDNYCPNCGAKMET